MLASADHAAAAALRELPEALILVFDKELRFVLSAGHALEHLGDTGVYREGESLQGTFPAALWKLVEPLFRSALDGETRSREIWTPEQRHCLMVDVGPLRLDGSTGGEEGTNVAGGVAVVLDITARRRADLLEPKSHTGDFEEVFERAPIGTALLDSDGRWLLVNRALCEITGYTADELIGKRFEEIVHPDDVNNDAEQRRRLLEGKISVYQVEKRYLDAAEETVSAILSVSLVRDRDGAPLHYIAQLQDISERKRLEEHLRHLADHDPLTGLRNRRLFEHDLKLQVARSQRYGEIAILQNLEALGDWSTAKAQPGKIILGELGGIETGVRQLLRSRPLETTEIEVRGKQLVLPTAAEILRIKAWLALSRNQTRDYLDIAALADSIGLDEAAGILRSIDDYYADINTRPEAVATQLVRQLADPRPRDAEVTTQLASYKALDPRWQHWSTVEAVLADLAERIV
jgi:PAS domain S-box-containing protein